MYNIIRLISKWVLSTLYKVEVTGLEHFEQAGKRVMVVANHTSFLDALLLAAFLPDKLTFAVNTQVSQRWSMRVMRSLVNLFPMDPMNPLSTKSLIKYLKEDNKVVIFPEGRITVTGSLMKIYQGPGLIADKSDTMVLPVRIDGAQYSTMSRMKGQVRTRLFPKITLSILPPRKLTVSEHAHGRVRRHQAGQELTDLMTEMMFETSNYHSTLVDSLLEARRIHGGDHVVIEDVKRDPMTYNQIVTKAMVLGKAMSKDTSSGDYVGVLLPSSTTTVVAFMGLHFYGRIPAMLNFTVGSQGMVSACQTADIKVVYTSRRFVHMAKLEQSIELLADKVKVVYLEDVSDSISVFGKIAGVIKSYFAQSVYKRQCAQVTCNDPAVVLFTSGSEGTPKGVVLSHANLLANRQQLASRIDFSSKDVILNALPLFHSFGLTAGTILPLISGIKTFFYPSPLHYRIVPEIAYDINATIMFGTNTFLSGYARFAHPYDFYSMRYVFAGAEKLKDEVRQVWEQKFGVRVFEGYGATETGPALSSNTAMSNKPGTVGRLLPNVDYRLEPVPGVETGGRLYVSGPNIMLGYLLNDNPGVLVPAESDHGKGWYDTGDIVSIDDEGFLTIRGRAKRFAKVAGEMVSLTAVETLVSNVWPNSQHAVVTIPDSQKGEQLVLVTNQKDATRAALVEQARSNGIGEINVPRKILAVKQVPVLGTGKTDYISAQQLVNEELVA